MKFYFLIILTFLLGCENTSELVQLGDGTFESKYKFNDSINLTKYYDIDKKLIGKIYFNIQSKNRLAFVYENKKLILAEYKNQKKRDFVIYKTYNQKGYLESSFLRSYQNENLIQKDYYKSGKIKEIKYFLQESNTINSSISFDKYGTENTLSNYFKIKYNHDTLHLLPTKFKNKNFLECYVFAFSDLKLTKRIFVFAQKKSTKLSIPLKFFRKNIPNQLFLKIKYFWHENNQKEKWSEIQYVEIKDVNNPPKNNLFFIKTKKR